MRLSQITSRILVFPMLLATVSCGANSAPVVSQPFDHAAARSHAAAEPTTAFFADTSNSRQLDATIDGKTAPFFVKGVDYGLTQIGDYPDPNPLDDSNAQIWTPNLQAMRQAGVNAVKVYNVTLKDFVLEKPKQGQTGKIDAFLKAAWNNGNRPIFVVLSIFFGGVDALDRVKLAALKAEYNEMSRVYSASPAVMGIGIGSEINSESLINNDRWWKNLNEISAEVTRGYNAAGAQKIITTTMVDDDLNTMVAGEKNGFNITAWGIDSYRGNTFTNIWQQVLTDTKKPFLMAEYGAPASSYKKSSAIYNAQLHHCTNYPPNLPGPDDVAQLPGSGNPRMGFLVDYVTDNATELGANAVTKGGVGSGGFYFEWNDEWWKSGYPKGHVGGAPGDGKIIVNQNAVFPGCYQDEAWFGLNSLSAGSPNPQHARPTLQAIKTVWATQ